MIMRLERTVLHILCLCLLISCNACSSCITVVPPAIVITGEKTIIERQIVGEYREIEKDAWIISSAMTPVYGARSTAAGASGDRELMTALRIRDFNDEKIRKYKDEGSVGETAEGVVAYRQAPRYEKDPEARTTLMKAVGEENSARSVIFRRSLESAAEPSGDEIAAAGRKFAAEQELLSRKGDWIRDANGKWYRKK